jgi:hypothetical protein
MLGIHATDDLLRFGCAERMFPCLWCRPCIWHAVPVDKTAEKQVLQLGVQHRKGEGKRHGGDHLGSFRPVREIARLDAFSQREWLPTGNPPAAERVHAFHEQLKEQNGEPKTIVQGGSVLILKALPLEFWCGKFGLSHDAPMHHAITWIRDLQRIGVD